MNKTFGVRRVEQVLPSTLLTVCLSLLQLRFSCQRPAADKLRADSDAPTPNAVIAPSPVTTIPAPLPGNRSSTIAPANYSECLTLLQGTDRISPVLVEAVAQLLNHPENASEAVPQRPPSLMAVTWRENAGQVRDIVVQAYYNPIGGDVSTLNADGYVRARLGGEFPVRRTNFSA